MSTPGLVENFFRHEYGRLVAVLTRRVGLQNVETVEDAVQQALMRALETWTVHGQPESPSAWLFQVAHNELLGQLRQQSSRLRILKQLPDLREDTPRGTSDRSWLDGVEDDLLRMLFACCDEAVPIESQLVFALKTLCGFGVHEIAARLFTTDANVYKRLGRARAQLRQQPLLTEITSERCTGRLPAIHKVLYLLFTEGHLSSHPEFSIRKELCEEAVRLAKVLADHPIGQVPETFALLALMHLHMARMNARCDGAGGLLLLEEQDRTLWNRDDIEQGLSRLGESAHGDRFSRYHAEAGVAAEHCLAASFHETRWDRIVACYELLERVSPSPIHRLNQAIAVAEWQGPAAGLDRLRDFEPPSWLTGSYMWAAVLSDLHRRHGDTEAAVSYRAAALGSAPTKAVEELLWRRLSDSANPCKEPD